MAFPVNFLYSFKLAGKYKMNSAIKRKLVPFVSPFIAVLPLQDQLSYYFQEDAEDEADTKLWLEGQGYGSGMKSGEEDFS